MFKRLITILALLVTFAVNAQHSRSLSPSIRTTQMVLNGEWGTLPVMQMGSDDVHTAPLTNNMLLNNTDPSANTVNTPEEGTEEQTEAEN